MNKWAIFFFIVLSSCTSIQEELTIAYYNKEVYVCHDDLSLSTGKKTIKNITPFKDNGYFNISLINGRGEIETTNIYSDDSNHIAGIWKKLQEEPFCSQSEYLENKKNKELEKKRKEQEELQKELDKKDCETSINRAYQARKKLDDDIFIFNDNEVVNLDRQIVKNNSENFMVVETRANGVIVYTNCGLLHDVGDALKVSAGRNSLIRATGHLINALCKEEYIFVYTFDNDYATNEKFKSQNKIYKRMGTYEYNDKLIKAYIQTPNDVSLIEYKTYLNNKKLKCK